MAFWMNVPLPYSPTVVAEAKFGALPQIPVTMRRINPRSLPREVVLDVLESSNGSTGSVRLANDEIRELWIKSFR